jgi:Zn-dependent protease
LTRLRRRGYVGIHPRRWVIGGFLNWTFPLFRIFGIGIRCHWFYPVLVAMQVLRGLHEDGTIGMALNAALMGALLVTTIVHELGHCFAARGVGGHADEILLWPLGGLAYVGHGGAPRDDIKVAFAGPITHLPLAGICAGLLLWKEPWNWSYLNLLSDWYPFFPFREYFWWNVCVGVFKLQLVLFFFNLLVPAYPLDGGRILTNFLLIRYGRATAAVATTYVAIPIGVAILVWAYLQRDLLFGFIGVWVLFEAWQIRRLAALGEIDQHPMFGQAPEFDYRPERPRRKGWFARWRERRAQRRAVREMELEALLRDKVDAVLEKVSREGMGSLSAEERRILEEASRRSRGGVS